MDKGKAMKVMAESHRETVNELEDRIYAIGESYRQEREYNHQLEGRNKQLKSNLSVVQGYYKNMIKINEDIVLENKRYRHVLGFYVDKDNYKEFNDIMRARKVTMVLEDNGIKAREALEGDPHESS